MQEIAFPGFKFQKFSGGFLAGSAPAEKTLKVSSVTIRKFLKIRINLYSSFRQALKGVKFASYR
jgi:hypothetical protein